MLYIDRESGGITMRLDVYGNEEDCAKIKKYAKQAGLSVSRYLLSSGLKGCKPITGQNELGQDIYKLTLAGKECADKHCEPFCPVMAGAIRIFTRRYEE